MEEKQLLQIKSMPLYQGFTSHRDVKRFLSELKLFSKQIKPSLSSADLKKLGWFFEKRSAIIEKIKKHKEVCREDHTHESLKELYLEIYHALLLFEEISLFEEVFYPEEYRGMIITLHKTLEPLGLVVHRTFEIKELEEEIRQLTLHFKQTRVFAKKNIPRYDFNIYFVTDKHKKESPEQLLERLERSMHRFALYSKEIQGQKIMYLFKLYGLSKEDPGDKYTLWIPLKPGFPKKQQDEIEIMYQLLISIYKRGIKKSYTREFVYFFRYLRKVSAKDYSAYFILYHFKRFVNYLLELEKHELQTYFFPKRKLCIAFACYEGAGNGDISALIKIARFIVKQLGSDEFYFIGNRWHSPHYASANESFFRGRVVISDPIMELDTIPEGKEYIVIKDRRYTLTVLDADLKPLHPFDIHHIDCGVLFGLTKKSEFFEIANIPFVNVSEYDTIEPGIEHSLGLGRSSLGLLTHDLNIHLSREQVLESLFQKHNSSDSIKIKEITHRILKSKWLFIYTSNVNGNEYPEIVDALLHSKENITIFCSNGFSYNKFRAQSLFSGDTSRNVNVDLFQEKLIVKL